jgi:hypothetical protein
VGPYIEHLGIKIPNIELGKKHKLNYINEWSSQHAYMNGKAVKDAYREQKLILRAADKFGLSER